MKGLIITSFMLFANQLIWGQNIPTDCINNENIQDVITPNSDGFNDVFTIEHFCSDTANFSIKIFNINGGLVYTSLAHDFIWDATDVNGNVVTPGLYLFIIEYKWGSSNMSKSGTLNILI